jgi:predicted amidohydrolase
MMRIGIYQFAPRFGKKKENLDRIESALQKSDADLIVLPELCTTGYQFVSKSEVESLCEPVPAGETVQRWIEMCRRKNGYLAAGIGEKADGQCYNASVLVGPKGYIGTYRKIHLFREEKQWLAPGNLGFPVWQTDLATIGMMICFDWIFPESARSLALRGAEIICHPANLILPFCQSAMITRSIENRVFTVTANRTGHEARGGKERLTFTGGSQVVAPNGKILFRFGENEEAFRSVEIDPKFARDKQITPVNHLWEDRRPDSYYSGQKGI